MVRTADRVSPESQDSRGGRGCPARKAWTAFPDCRVKTDWRETPDCPGWTDNAEHLVRWATRATGVNPACPDWADCLATKERTAKQGCAGSRAIRVSLDCPDSKASEDWTVQTGILELQDLPDPEANKASLDPTDFRDQSVIQDPMPLVAVLEILAIQVTLERLENEVHQAEPEVQVRKVNKDPAIRVSEVPRGKQVCQACTERQVSLGSKAKQDSTDFQASQAHLAMQGDQEVPDLQGNPGCRDSKASGACWEPRVCWAGMGFKGCRGSKASKGTLAWSEKRGCPEAPACPGCRVDWG